MDRGYDARAAGGFVDDARRSPVDVLHRARRDPTRVLLEGVHATKHAVRFGARLDTVASPDLAAVRRLLAELAPDVTLPIHAVELDAGTFAALTGGRTLPSPLLAAAGRPTSSPAEVLARPGRVVVLDRPRHLGNLGAVIRVVAAAGGAGVLVLGDADPWHPTAVRAAAGLQFALGVARSTSLPPTTRPLVALAPDPAAVGDGAVEPAAGSPLPADAVLLVGTERGGLDASLVARADARIALPMRPGVSSLNLATAVAAALYRW